MNWLRRLQGRLTYANVMASIAVVISLGGTGYAAIQLPRNSVGTKQIRPNAVRASDVRKNAVGSGEIRANAVDTSEIRDGGVSAEDLGPGVAILGPQGPTGPQGSEGPQGPQGPPGPSTGPAGGDLVGTYPNPLLRAGAVTPQHISGIPSARAEQGRLIDQAVGSSANVQFNVEIHDTADMFDPAQNTRMTFRTDGVYIVTGAARWAENPTGVRTIGLVLNDSGLQFLAADTRLNNGASDPVRQHVSAIACFRAGSFVVLRALQSSGTSLNITNAGSPQVHLAATWIAPAPPRQFPLPSPALRNCIEPA